MSARKLLLLHGFTGSPRSFRRVLEAHPFEGALTPPLCGHDATPADPALQSFDDEVDRLAALVRGASAERVHVAGYSLGARVALGLLVRHPALFSAATLIGVHPGLERESERAERVAGDEAWCRLLESEGLPHFVRAWQNQPIFSTQTRLPAELLAEQESERHRHDPRGLLHALRCLGLGKMPNFRPALPGLDVPVKLLVGALDLKFVALAHQMCDRLPRGEVMEVARAGHNLLLERPDAVARTLWEAVRA
jgi:2-succinyl-6-hydroxy-2,4-cyclohexadiene-1-carboxylate synthase